MMIIDLIDQVRGVLAGISEDVPQPTPVKPPFGDGIQTILSWGIWLAAAGLVGSLMGMGIRMAWAYKDGGEAHLGGFIWIAFGCALIGGASAVVNTFI